MNWGHGEHKLLLMFASTGGSSVHETITACLIRSDVTFNSVRTSPGQLKLIGFSVIKQYFRYAEDAANPLGETYSRQASNIRHACFQNIPAPPWHQ